jgi:hypothetical protein
VQWSDYPEDYIAKLSRDVLYDHAAQGAALAVRGTIKSSRQLELSGFVGREVVVDDGRGHANLGRFFSSAGRLHVATVATAPERLSGPVVQAFLDSLRLDRNP